MQAFFHRRCGFAGLAVAEHWLNLPVCIRPQPSTIPGRHGNGVLPCSGIGFSTFFLQTKKRVRRVDLCIGLQFGVAFAFAWV